MTTFNLKGIDQQDHRLFAAGAKLAGVNQAKFLGMLLEFVEGVTTEIRDFEGAVDVLEHSEEGEALIRIQACVSRLWGDAPWEDLT